MGCLKETYFKYMNTDRLKVNIQKKIYHTKRNHKKAGMVTLTPDKLYFKTKAIPRNKRGAFKIILKDQFTGKTNQYVCT